MSRYYAVVKIYQQVARYRTFAVLSTFLPDSFTLVEVSLLKNKWISLDVDDDLKGLENETDFVLAMVFQ
jgi:hypothetical protein